MHTRRFLPRLEQVETRAVPAVLTSYSDGVLSIASDDTTAVDHRVCVRVEDTQIVVVTDGQRQVFGDVAALKTINATLGEGNDFLKINLLNSVHRDAVLTVQLDAGAGNDCVKLLSDRIGRGAAVTAEILAGSGADKIHTNLGEVGQLASAQIHMDLGTDEDQDIVRLATGNIGANGFIDFCLHSVVVADAGVDASTVDVIDRTNIDSNAAVCVNEVKLPPLDGPTGEQPSPGSQAEISKFMLLGSTWNMT